MSRKWMVRIGATVLVLAGLGVTATVAGATAGTDHILRGEKLVSDAQQKSNNGAYKLVQQKDGNLVEYRTKDSKVMWSTKTSGAPGAYTTLQKDGNLVVTRGAQQKPLWKSGTDGSGATELVVQNDGNVVLYAGAGRTRAVWASQGLSSNAGQVGDDYPARWKGPLGSTTDSWGQYNRYCTSFVAWRLHSRNGYELPRWKGNANTWDDQLGHVSRTPRAGAVAQTDAGTYGHVAWVAEVRGNTVVLEDYNSDLKNPGTYRRYTAPAGNYKYLNLNN